MKKSLRQIIRVVGIILFFHIPIYVLGQGLEKTFGGTGNDNGLSVQQTTDGGYITTGITESFGSGDNDVYLIKTNNYGDTLWTKTFGGTDSDDGYSVQQTSDEGYIIAGHTESFGYGSYDVYLIRTNNNGDTLWTKTFGGAEGDLGKFVQQTTDGGFIITGQTISFGNGLWDIYLIKTDNNGDTLWTKTFGGTDWEKGYSVQQTTDGGYIITGTTLSFGSGNDDVYLIKTDSYGDTLWTKTFGGTDSDEGRSVQQTSDGGYIITGWTGSFGNGSYDVYLIRTDNYGDTLWTKTIGGSGWDRGYSVQQTTDEGYIITGWTDSFGIGGPDLYLIKTDNNGDTLWTKTFGGTDYDIGMSVQKTSNGGYIITGHTYSYGMGGSDVYLIKTNGNGNTVSIIDISGINPNRKLIKTIDFLGRDINPLKNVPYIEIYDDGTYQKKMILDNH